MTPKHPTKTKTGKADLSPFALSGLGSAGDGAGHDAQADVHGGHAVRPLWGKLATASCVAALTICVVVVLIVPGLLGLQRYVITGGSMTGTIPKGALIYSRITPVGQLKVGDIITFNPPGYSSAVTHRIVAVETGPDGGPAFRTKGDFNEAPETWNPVKLNGAAAGSLRAPGAGAGLRARRAQRADGADRAHRPPGRPDRPLAALVVVAPGRRGSRTAARGRRPAARRERQGLTRAFPGSP